MATCDRQSPAPCSRSPNSRLPDPTSTSASIDVLLHPTAATPAQAIRSRGSYSCGRCGLPKKGHICPDGGGPVSAPRIRIRRRRALSFDVDPVSREMVEKAGVVEILNGFEKAAEGATVLPVSCMVEVLRRLSPKELMRAAAVCRRWRGCVRRVWRSAEELRLRVLSRSQMGFVGSLLHRCAGLSRLTLRMESDVDATMLACVAYSLPNLEAFEMNMAENAMNRISGYELCRFVAMKGFLSSLKFEGCSNVGSLNITSSSLTTLWLSDLYCVSKVALKCPNLTELSLDFCQQENDTTDLVTMMECLGCTCPLLRNVHIASIRLCDKSVFALTSANLRSLRMLSLVLGSRITDDAVTSIASCYTNLELLDLSGSSISDNGLRMIRNVLPNTLSRLLLSLCPNITCNELQFAVTQLPLLQLIDCGMSIRDTSCQYANSGETMCFPINGNGHKIRHLELSPTKSQKNYQKLIIQHDSLKKLSLWGCSGVDALYLNCPELNDLNLNLCTNLHPEKLLLQCPNLKDVHASGCQDMLIGAIRNQVANEFAALKTLLPCKRLADGTKRVLALHSAHQKKPNPTVHH
ncbi:F-box/LRR-repeat protein 17-like [Zingiber officinale]|uniref:F-box/LRR-repeat protein 17-like n=1 Tax=Zingiber officinale TaxID=94328 RepID=UPI001C4CA79F|nr:F-box/LRR-repeat protein 17-like [Zingiber officinale]